MSLVRDDDVPVLSPGVRVHEDTLRDRRALLGPEQVVLLTRGAHEILRRLGAGHSVREIADTLLRTYPRAPVREEMDVLLPRLAREGLVRGVPVAGPDPESTARSPTDAPVLEAPLAVLAELTYRCPLQCPYCSNPVDLARDEMDTDAWIGVARQAHAAGAWQFHLSGGEPLLHPGCVEIVRAARQLGLYVNLITSAAGLTEDRLDALAEAGLEHAQISLQHTDPDRADALAGTALHARKLAAARGVVARGMALSLNLVVHRESLDAVMPAIALAESLGAARIELATVQVLGWALRNRDALLPERSAFDAVAAPALAARDRLRGKTTVILVRPDHWTGRPRPCMDGWGRKFMTVIPDGTVLPCPGAHALPLPFSSLRTRTLAEIWRQDPAFDAYRGTAWMPEPCASCDERFRDHGGCRCQAHALTANARATDPACDRSPHHATVLAARARSLLPAPDLIPRVRARGEDR